MANWENQDFYIGEDNFFEEMKNKVEPWVSTMTQGFFTAEDGTKIHFEYKVNEAEKGAIVLSHGFCEFFGKFYETAYYFYQAGYSVFFIEHRGHALSDRKVEDPDMVHITDYEEYVSDLHQFITEVVQVNAKTTRLLLFAHSMGGLIGTLYLEEHPDVFTAAILSSPMHRINYGAPEWVVQILMAVATLFHWDKKYGPGQTGLSDKYDPEHSSEMSVPRYEYYRNFRLTRSEWTMYGGSYGWIKAGIRATKKGLSNAGAIKTPFLLCEGEKDTMVDNTGHDDFLKETGSTNRIIYPGSKHEMYAATPEIRFQYYQDVFRYFDSFCVD